MVIKLAIAEDNYKLASLLKQKIEYNSQEIKVEYIARNGDDIINYIKKESNIQIILMDIEMPIIDGITATREIKELYPELKIIILTVFDDDDKILEAILAGANGYLLKDESADEIIKAIKVVIDGGAIMTSSIASKVLNMVKNISLQNNTKNENILGNMENLTKREIEILEYIRDGFDYKEIANKLFISPATVRKHIENIYEKLQVHNKMQAVQKAIKNRII